MNKENIIAYRRGLVKRILEGKGLDAALVLNPGIGNWATWLFAEEGIPTLPPFNRNNTYVVPAEGEILKFCALQPHPTDRAQFPLFDCGQLESLVSGGSLGVVNPGYLKKSVSDSLMQRFPDLALVDVTAEFEAAKAEKCQEETAGVAAAAKIYDRMFTAMPLILRAEKLEKEAVVDMRMRLVEMGSEAEDQGVCNVVNLTSAPDGGLSCEEPLLWPGRRFAIGDRVNVTVNGYLPGGFAAAMGRSFIIGKASDEAQKYWKLTVRTQELAASLCVPGATVAGAAVKIDKFLKENGVLPYDGLWLYGTGCARCEAPRNIDDTGSMPLKEGMTLVIAPKVKPEGKDAYCCMDMFVVREGGAIRLSGTSQALKELF